MAVVQVERPLLDNRLERGNVEGPTAATWLKTDRPIR